MTRWIGRWLMVVGLLHCLSGGLLFAPPLLGIVQDGLWNTIHADIARQAAFWFEVVGLTAILFGALVDRLEKMHDRWPRWVGYGFLLLTLLIIVVLPIGGGWLLLPPAVGLAIGGKNR